MYGIHLTFPFRLGSVWVELRHQHLGIGFERQSNDVEFFAGRVAGVWSRWRAPQMATVGR